MISGEAFYRPADGGPARSLGIVRGFSVAEVEGAAETIMQYERLTVELQLADASLRALWAAFLPMYRLDALRHQLKRKGRPGWKRQKFAPMTKWRM